MSGEHVATERGAGADGACEHAEEQGTDGVDPVALQAVLEPAVVAAGFEFEGVTVSGSGGGTRVDVAVDRDPAPTLDAIAELAEHLNQLLDEHPELTAMVPAYRLELGTRGVGAPLERTAHFRRARGRKLAIELADGQRLIARLGAATETTIEVLLNHTTQKGAPAKFEERTLERATIARAVVEVEFTPAPAAELARTGAPQLVIDQHNPKLAPQELPETGHDDAGAHAAEENK